MVALHEITRKAEDIDEEDIVDVVIHTVRPDLADQHDKNIKERIGNLEDLDLETD